MTYEEIRDMNVQELHATLRAERNMLQKLRFNHAVSPIENPGKIRASKKVIARLLTEINRRKTELEKEQAKKEEPVKEESK